MSTIPFHYTVPQILSLANTKDAPWIKKRRTISSKRILYSVRSDFLVYYTDIWYRNRFPDSERVFEIMRSIEQEGEPDNRIYLAWIKDKHEHCKLMCFDGNHRREALIRLYLMKGFTCWVDLDILMNVKDLEVIQAFRRINLGVSIPDLYVEDMEVEKEKPLEETSVHQGEKFVELFRKQWRHVLVDKNRTRAPYCTKNDIIDICLPYVKNTSPETVVSFLKKIDNYEKKQAMTSQQGNYKTCTTIQCFLFYHGLSHIRKYFQDFPNVPIENGT